MLDLSKTGKNFICVASIRLLYSVHIGFADAECVCVCARCMDAYLIQNRGTRWWSGHGCTALQCSFWLFPLCHASPFQFVSGANTGCITQLSAWINGRWYLQCKWVLGLLGDVDMVLGLFAWKLCFWTVFSFQMLYLLFMVNTATLPVL